MLKVTKCCSWCNSRKLSSLSEPYQQKEATFRALLVCCDGFSVWGCLQTLTKQALNSEERIPILTVNMLSLFWVLSGLVKSFMQQTLREQQRGGVSPLRASSNPPMLGLSVGRMVCLHCTWQHKGITWTVFSSWSSTMCLWTTSPMTTWLRCMSLPTAATTKSPRFSWTRKLILMPKHWWVHSRVLFTAKHSCKVVLRLTGSCSLPADGWQRGCTVAAAAQEQTLEVQSVNNIPCNQRRPLLADSQQ